jgi:hypothetical protein
MEAQRTPSRQSNPEQKEPCYKKYIIIKEKQKKIKKEQC